MHNVTTVDALDDNIADSHRMMKQISFRNLLGGALAAVFALSGVSAAAETEQRLIVKEVVIYMGVLPAEIIAEQAKGHHEPNMHRGIPDWGEQYHVIVALFDHTNWARITDADVSATLSDARVPGRRVAGPRKPLGPMMIAGSAAYGNYFHIPGNGPYRIDLEIRRPGTEQPIRASFLYRHAVFSMQPRP
jgi:hypothetical protein